MDPSYYYVELGISAVLGFIFGNKIENIIGAIILGVIVIAGISLLNQELSNPTAIANNTTGLVNFVVFATNFLPSLTISGIGTAIGIIIGNKLK